MHRYYQNKAILESLSRDNGIHLCPSFEKNNVLLLYYSYYNDFFSNVQDNKLFINSIKNGVITLKKKISTNIGIVKEQKGLNLSQSTTVDVSME